MLTSTKQWRGSPSKRLSLAIALFCGALLILLWCGLLFEARHDQQIALGQARKDTSNLVIAFREHIGRTLSAIDQVLLVIKDEYHRDPDHYQLPDWLKSSPLLAGMAVEASIIGPDGFLKQTDLAGAEQHIDLSDRRHFRYHLDPNAPQPYISTPVIGRSSGRLSLQVSRRLEHADGSFAGVIVVSLDPFYLSQFFDTVDLGERGVVSLVGRDGIVRSRRSGTSSQIGQDITGSALFTELEKASSGSYVARSKVDGVHRVYGYAAVPDYPLVVAIGIAVDEILAEPERERAAHYLFGVGISLVLVLLTALLLHEVALGRGREEEISAQASLTKTILDVTPSAIWVKDEQGRFEIVNDAMADLFKKRKEELVGRRTSDLLPPEEAEKILAWDDESAMNEGITIGGEHTLPVEDGQRRLLAFRRTCVLGGRSLVVGAAMDITLLRRAEEELRSEMRQRELAEAGLRQAQKMEAIGRLTGGVAHDFNNLLTSILGNIELAVRRVREAPTLRLLHNAERAALRGADLIQHLLAFARKQHLRTEPVDLNKLVLGMRDLLDRTIGLMVRIETTLDPELWTALADANQVESAVLNIAINARDAMPKGGQIIIRTTNAAAGAGLPPELAPADYVTITVIDTGCGMTAEVMAMAFDPFFTTKDVGKGSGLGLSQVYGMVRQSGGTATIDSTPGQGTSVRLYLPRAPGKAPVTSRDAPVESDVRHEGAAMLVVDNDGEVRSVMAAYLHDAGHQVHQADSGHAALDCVAAKPVDVMIVDSQVADMTGTELAKQARQKRPELKILYITGEPGAEVSNTDAVLVKPIRAAQLVAAIDGILEAEKDSRAERVRRSAGSPARHG